jgi:hypothetical protein
MNSRETEMLKAFFQHKITSSGVMHPNSSQLNQKIGRLLLTPPFRGLGVTVREFRDLYVKLSSDMLVGQDKSTLP